MSPDPYKLHRLALAPLIPDENADGLGRVFDEVREIGEEPFVRFIARQGLAPMWHSLVATSQLEHELPAPFSRALRQQRQEATAHYMLQKAGLKTIRETLEPAGVSHAVYKGTATRERLYADPALRPAGDIDVLITPAQRDEAIQILLRAGFTLEVKAKNASNEVSLARGPLIIDLHWDILRPGRTRAPMVERFLESREDRGDHWALDDAAATFIALVHPVFAKHATLPIATLNSALDLHHWLLRWNRTAEHTTQLLEIAGLRTAAWIALRRLTLLTPQHNYTALARLQAAAADLAPGALRQRYLDLWLAKDLATRLRKAPWVVKIGFTLGAHDRSADAVAASRMARHLASRASLDAQALQSLAADDDRRTQSKKERLKMNPKITAAARS